MHFSTAALLALLSSSMTYACTVTVYGEKGCTGQSISTDGYTSGCHTLGDVAALQSVSLSDDCADPDHGIGFWGSTNCDGDRQDIPIQPTSCLDLSTNKFSYGCDKC